MKANKKSREQSEEDELEELDAGPAEEAEMEGESAETVSVRGRGRPPIPTMWTKVISLSHDDLEMIKVHDLATDLKMAPSLPGLPTGRRNKFWTPVFSPQMFVKEHEDVTLENYKLRERRLLNLGKQISQCRQKFRDAALAEAR